MNTSSDAAPLFYGASPPLSEKFSAGKIRIPVWKNIEKTVQEAYCQHAEEVCTQKNRSTEQGDPIHDVQNKKK